MIISLSSELSEATMVMIIAIVLASLTLCCALRNPILTTGIKLCEHRPTLKKADNQSCVFNTLF